MNDDELLHGFRPAGPPPELRARVMSSATASAERSSLRDWLPAIATAAVIALLYVAGTEIRAAAYAQLIETAAPTVIEVPSR
jgi:hypothetical protein